MKTLLSILLFASCCAAKDRPATKPVLTPDQKIVLLTAERELLAAQNQALPYEIAKQHALEALQVKQADVVKDVDAAKWRLDLMTLDFTEVPQPVTPPVKPAEKK